METPGYLVCGGAVAAAMSGNRAVAAAMSGKSKSLMTAAVVESSAEHESDPKKAKGLASKVMKMKEDITREVLERATAMADREEKAVLMTAIKALNKSDSTRALKVCLCPASSSSAQKQARGPALGHAVPPSLTVLELP